MRSFISYARSTFVALGILEIVLSVTFVLSPAKGKHLWPHIVTALLGMAWGTLSCLAGAWWRTRKPLAKPLIAVASLTHLALFPFGTVAGAIGLCWCCSRRMRELEPLVETFEYKSNRGDGTNAWVQKLILGLEVVVGILSVSAVDWWGKAHHLQGRPAMDGLLPLFLCLWFCVFCHEAGHAIAGWIVEMRLKAFAVGPVIILESEGRYKLKLSVASMMRVWGYVASSPLHLRKLRPRMAVELAGGPLASAIVGVAAWGVLLAVPGTGLERYWKIPALIASFSIVLAQVNLIPFATVAGFSDGARLTQLLRGGPFADLQEALKIAVWAGVTPLRPRELNVDAFARGLCAARGRPEAGLLRAVLIYCAVDRGDLAEARRHLADYLAAIPRADKALNAAIAAEKAFYMCYLNGDVARAREWLSDAEQLAPKQKIPLRDRFEYWLALGSVCRGEAKMEQAEAAWQRALVLAERRPKSGIHDYELELLHEVWKGIPALHAA